ncbi:MAG: KH domain-containing protein [Desulfobulbaceae bacterium]|nr:KH domain-containing protein [Desulfobulbaceae bacterium]
MKELVKFIASSLVDNPESVQVEEVVQDDTVVYALRVAKEDLGKVIGKQGRTARAIRALLTATAGKTNRKARLEIVE